VTGTRCELYVVTRAGPRDRALPMLFGDRVAAVRCGHQGLGRKLLTETVRAVLV
jgi:hypothetical protein